MALISSSSHTISNCAYTIHNHKQRSILTVFDPFQRAKPADEKGTNCFFIEQNFNGIDKDSKCYSEIGEMERMKRNRGQ